MSAFGGNLLFNAPRNGRFAFADWNILGQVAALDPVQQGLSRLSPFSTQCEWWSDNKSA